MKNPYRSLEKALGYRFRRRRHLETALTHGSFVHEAGQEGGDNQRLEFLGDAALGLVAAHQLYEANPDLQEGDLTRLRSRLASTRALGVVAAHLGLGPLLRLGKGEDMSGGQHRLSNLCDALEAVIGAAYLDGGLKAVQKIFRKLFLPLLDTAEQDVADNPKGLLQEWSQRNGLGIPRYVVVREEGPAHARVYTIEARVGDRVMGVGKGTNKRSAEQDAAFDAVQSKTYLKISP
jgi:ribonuclease III